MQEPDEVTQEWVRSIVGPFRILSRFAHDHGYSQLWRLRAGSDYVWLKMHAHPHKWAGEVHALTQWKDALAPTVLAWTENPERVLLTEVPGMDAETLELVGPSEEKLWSEAGAWLKMFHARQNEWMGNVRVDGSPHGAPMTDAVAHVQANFEKRLFQGRDSGLLDAREFEFSERRFRELLPSLEGEGACSIHRDFTPRNWLAQPNGGLSAVIDFEHARWDVRAADLNRPWDYEFLRNPRLIRAFYEAYGEPDDRLAAQIQALRLYNVVTGVVWAVEVGDLPFSERNRAALHRLMGE